MTIGIIAIVVILGAAYLFTRRSKKTAEPPQITVPGPLQDPTHDLPDPPKKGGQIP